MPTSDANHAGSRLGLPAEGRGSLAGWGRRFAALLVDWVVAQLVVSLFVGSDVWVGDQQVYWSVLATFVGMRTLLDGLLGRSIGHRLAGLAVVRLDRTPVGVWALVRTLLICLVVPPFVINRDGRGLHDLAAGTVIVRM